ncbi:carboxynorspermidine decarboxylase [Roseibacillus ishigakijimensis]|uniref:Carboxynorspermidine/carboxyspermidine decarboxylase n=1 Tax=Roseibacillus ishigakijimensis TaxID=454146 RepID=A0A934VMK3_9BACT|nr:carboxynorspermidine decarboxylase [Roseibacillus ishigakijimensis]MBK1834181.1 carboxynorspermidine decarboxylase [Roseibacillus ishigakijimensis]
MAQYLISLPALVANARILREVADQSGARIVLALKAFSLWPSFAAVRPYLDGCCASGLWEARLAHDHFGKDILTYSPAYSADHVRELLAFTTHLDFNSLSQWQRFREECLAHPRAQAGEVHFGLRINPLHSTGQTPLYDPCSPGCRLGVTRDQLTGADLSGLSTLHFHTLCEQPAQDLVSTMAAVERDFGELLASPQITDLNMGGGHWISKPDYDRTALVNLIRRIQQEYGVQVWLEPGEALAIHTGVLRATVLDVFASQGLRHAVLDISATCHMPDVLEMPYRPDVYLVGGEEAATAPAVTLPGESYELAGENGPCPHRLGGPSCLAGDNIGDFSFSRPLEVGDVLVFDDMAHYTFVKSTLFNGVPHPELALLHEEGTIETVRAFGYEDFAGRLGK